MFNMFTAYWLLGVAYFIAEMIQGGAAFLSKMLKEETSLIPPTVIPFLSIVFAVLCLGFGAIVALVWPLMMWVEYVKGDLFRRERWDE